MERRRGEEKKREPKGRTPMLLERGYAYVSASLISSILAGAFNP